MVIYFLRQAIKISAQCDEHNIILSAVIADSLLIEFYGTAPTVRNYRIKTQWRRNVLARIGTCPPPLLELAGHGEQIEQEGLPGYGYHPRAIKYCSGYGRPYVVKR